MLLWLIVPIKISINGKCLCEYVVTINIRVPLFLRSQGPLVATSGRTFKRRLAISSCTLTASAGAPCRSRRTERGWKPLVSTAVSLLPEEAGTLDSDGGWRWGDGLDECAGCVCQRWKPGADGKLKRHISNECSSLAFWVRLLLCFKAFGRAVSLCWEGVKKKKKSHALNSPEKPIPASNSVLLWFFFAMQLSLFYWQLYMYFFWVFFSISDIC